jgi:hypothetical protein
LGGGAGGQDDCRYCCDCNNNLAGPFEPGGNQGISFAGWNFLAFWHGIEPDVEIWHTAAIKT